MKIFILSASLLTLAACQTPASPTYQTPQAEPVYPTPKKQRHSAKPPVIIDEAPVGRQHRKSPIVQPMTVEDKSTPAQLSPVQPSPAQPSPDQSTSPEAKPAPWSKMEDRFITTHDPDFSASELKRPKDHVMDRLKELETK